MKFKSPCAMQAEKKPKDFSQIALPGGETSAGPAYI